MVTLWKLTLNTILKEFFRRVCQNLEIYKVQKKNLEIYIYIKIKHIININC